MADYSLIWDDLALKQLEGRDRYTRHAISDEFRRKLGELAFGVPNEAGVEIDPDLHEYVTGVSDDRFLVVWRLDEPAKQATVRAVVPNTNLVAEKSALHTPEDLNRLRDQVSRMVTLDLDDL